MKFCKDCKHFFVGECHSPGAYDFRDPVTGKYPMASGMRNGPPFKTLCGSGAKWYEATYEEGA